MGSLEHQSVEEICSDQDHQIHLVLLLCMWMTSWQWKVGVHQRTVKGILYRSHREEGVVGVDLYQEGHIQGQCRGELPNLFHLN